MEDRKARMSFLFVGNHPCLDFINTQLVVDGQPVDLLATCSDLVRWLTDAQLLREADAKKIDRHWGGEAQGAHMLDQAQGFRAALREMMERIISGKPVPQAAVEAINEMLGYRLGRPRLTRRKGAFAREFLADPQDGNQALGLLAEAAADLLCTCDLSLIKKCRNPACVLFFYDTSKNHARQWCSMNFCGNRSKVAAHYRRHRRRGK
jgi:predicted RNA-binding Zn ribbon-like protein